MSGKESLPLLLLHQCCAICSVPAVRELSASYRIHGYWYNPNIQPAEEYNSRREALAEFNRLSGIKTFLFEEERASGKDLFSPPELPAPGRCAFCYRERLNRTARFASQNGYLYFSTTLFSSPYQQHELAREIASEAARRWGVSLVYFDVRKNYYAGLDEIRKMGLYRQRYCGCLMSLAERNADGNKKKKPRVKNEMITGAISPL